MRSIARAQSAPAPHPAANPARRPPPEPVGADVDRVEPTGAERPQPPTAEPPPPTAPTASGARPDAAAQAQARAQRFARLPKAVAGALVGASLTAMVVGAPLEAAAQEVEPPPSSPVAESILNPRGVGNVSGTDRLFEGTRVERAPGRVVRTDPSFAVDPAAVMTAGPGSAAEIRQLVLRGASAQAVADALAERYGPFTAENSEANRRAIIDNLRFIAGTGVRYDHRRADSNDVTTQSPNHTLSHRSGVCRDTHTAAAAILASLMDARQRDGRWVAGSPTGRENEVQVPNFATPNEHHAFLVYRDPETGGWDALEYGRSYDLDAPNAATALRALPNHTPGYSIYRLTGWDSKPVIADRHVVDAASARAFFAGDPGVGEPGELRVDGGPASARLTGFVTPELSVSGEVRPGVGDRLAGGVKLNYHRDLVDADGHGYVRYGAGVYTSPADISDTGRRAAEHRAPVRTYALALKYDRRHESRARELIGERLQVRYGGDIDLTLAVPFGPEGWVPGSIGDYSNADVGVDGAVLGRERLGPHLTLDWAVQARYELDLIGVGMELGTSELSSWRTPGAEALKADYAMALTHEAESGLVTRFEVGGQQWLAGPLDPEVTPRGHHYAVMTVSPEDGQFDFGVLARGHQLDASVVPVDALGVALRITPSDDVRFGVSVDSVFPDGDLRRFGDDIQVRGNLSIRF